MTPPLDSPSSNVVGWLVESAGKNRDFFWLEDVARMMALRLDDAVVTPLVKQPRETPDLAETLQSLLSYKAGQISPQSDVVLVADIRRAAAKAAQPVETPAVDGLDRGCFVIMELMQAYERRIRSDCTTPEQLAAEPWRCAEYIKAERYLVAAAEASKALDAFLAHLRQPPTTRAAPCPICKDTGVWFDSEHERTRPCERGCPRAKKTGERHGS